jgi:hypothetical protein
MMLGAQLSDLHQAKLWAEAVMTATKLHNNIEAAFLETDLDKDIYIKWPLGARSERVGIFY